MTMLSALLRGLLFLEQGAVVGGQGGVAGGQGGVAGAAVLPACRCPCDKPQPAAVGTTSPEFKPAPEAFAHNRTGFGLYRQRRFEAAIAAYRAAIAADPDFLAPRLNIACAFTQEERFGDAVAEATALVERGFVPWAREIEEAVDLAPLRIRTEQQTLNAAIRRAGVAWGRALVSDPAAVPFIARTGPPVAIKGTGVLVLAPAQEIFAYLPGTGRYRQLTSEDGRVLAFARSPDGLSIVYLRGSKIIRSDGQPDRLRGLVLRRLSLVDMTLSPPVAVRGDVERLTMWFATEGTLQIRVSADDAISPEARLSFDGTRLSPSDALGRPGKAAVVLMAAGVVSPSRVDFANQSSGCRFVARDQSSSKVDQIARVVVVAEGRRFFLTAPFGAALRGLPFGGPAVPPSSPPSSPRAR